MEADPAGKEEVVMDNRGKSSWLLLLLLLSAVFVCAAARGRSLAELALPEQGMYDYCDIASEEGLRHLDELGAAGFQLVLPYTSGSSHNTQAEYRAYLERAEQNGIRVIWDFNELVGSADGVAEATAVVRMVKDHPATWGYYVGDEEEPERADAVRELSAAVRAADPDHPRMYVANYEVAALRPFADCAEYVGLDVYPIGQSADSTEMVAEVGTVGRNLQTFGAESGKRTVLVLQGFNWADDRNAPAWHHLRSPTGTEMRQMRDLALQSEPDIILWFSYPHAKKNRTEDFWTQLVWAATGR